MLRRKLTILFASLFLSISFMTLTHVYRVEAATMSERFAGSDRYLTAIAVSQSGWTEGASTVVLTTGEDYPDALSAAPLAGKYKAPLLLVSPSGISPETATELKRLNAKKAYIVGGKGVITGNLERQLSLMGISSVRLAGVDRYDTALAVAKVIGTSKGIFVTSGVEFADALSVAPIAAASGMPILLVPEDDLTPKEKAFVSKLKSPQMVIVGSATQIPQTIRDQFPSAVNIEGGDAYVRNTALLQYFGDTVNRDTIYVATGEDFPDALAASAFAQKDKNPLVLVKGNQIPAAAKSYLSANVISQIKVFGGSGVISRDTEQELKTLPAQIAEVRHLSAQIKEKQKYDLPQAVTIRTDQGNWEEVPVTWSLSTVSTLKAGTYYFEGKVNGYSSPVILTLTVDPLPSKVDKLTAEVVLGDAYSLPDTVTVTMSDNTSEEFPVTWTTTIGLLNKVGTYTFQGTVDGTQLKASLALMVSEDSVVKFNEYSLERLIREEVGKRNYAYPIYKSDVLKIRHLDAEDEGISDLTGMEALTNLKTLNLEDNYLNGEALTPLQKLTNLQSLDLEGNYLEQITALKGLTTLTELNISDNAIEDFSPLKGLLRLETLYLSGNATNDYSPIRVFYNQLTDSDFTL